MSCACDGSGECVCPDWRKHGPAPFATALSTYIQHPPKAECHQSRCKFFPDPCTCRRSPEKAEPGW